MKDIGVRQDAIFGRPPTKIGETVLQMNLDQLNMVLPQAPAGAVAQYSRLWCESAHSLGLLEDDAGLKDSTQDTQIREKYNALANVYPAWHAFVPLLSCASFTLSNGVTPAQLEQRLQGRSDKYKDFAVQGVRILCPQLLK
jgi:hypothetical protein